jgi:cell division protein FtsN
MRDVNPRSRERFELSLDGRQIASVIVGTIVVLAVVFVLGLNVGKQLARSEAKPTAGGGDALAALDQAPVSPPPAVRDESLTYHDRLVSERPAAGPAQPAAPRPEPAPAPAAEREPAPEPPPAADPAPPAEPPPSRAAEPAPDPEPAAARPVPEGEWCVQLGAAADRAESERLAARFERFSPRIEIAEVQGKTWYRVRVGAFATKGAAEKYLKDLARETGAKGFVTTTH